MKKFQVANVHCPNCVRTIKNALEGEFGEININLSTEPRELSVDINDDKVEKLKSELDELGFNVIKEL
ncbi:MAG: heavy-metal-associated domain-containing protein [Campylobacter sp.]|nr:heavy-metal-associated domain-containing protein [Campylobacter sp.]